MFAVLISTLLLAGADPAPSAATDAPATANATDKKPSASDVTCWDERPTGSHVTKRVCASREELEKAQRDAKASLDSRNIGRKNPFHPS